MRNFRVYAKSLVICLTLIIGLTINASAQSTEFSYQGFLNDTSASANGNFDFEFRLFSAASGGTLEGTNQRLNVAVTNGVFSVTLDFGAGAFPGADRFLEILVKPAGGGSLTTLAPRPRIGRAPYAISSGSADQAAFAINANNAIAATTANNALQLGGVTANQFVQTNDSRLTDARNPLPNSTNYVQNRTTPQTTSNFNISGTGTANVFSATQYNIGNNRVIGSIPFSFFAGIGAGTSNTTGVGNAFFGLTAGTDNTTGSNNSFFGISAGATNSTGSANSFFGTSAGINSTTANNNSFFGAAAGFSNSTGSANSFFGESAGRTSTTATENSFFGASAGRNNSTGSANSYFGTAAGLNTTTASNNSFFGAYSGLVNTTGNSNAFFGADAGRNNTLGGRNSFFGFGAGRSNTSAARNSFFGTEAGLNSTGQDNSFFGDKAGRLTIGLGRNSFFGSGAGENNTGSDNVFIGYNAGNTNTTGENNTAIGAGASVSGSNTNFATAIGAGASVSSSNTIVLGRNNDTVDINGVLSVSNISNLSEIEVSSFGTALRVVGGGIEIGGSIKFDFLSNVGGNTNLCRSASNYISTCSSSLRYKTDINPFSSGLILVNRLQPITFNWKEGGMRDLGLGAEDVEKVEPLLVTYNDKGEVEGVKYDRVAVVLLNAVKEQQAQIEEQKNLISAQQTQIDEQKKKEAAQQTQIDEQKKKDAAQQTQLDRQQAEIRELSQIVKTIKKSATKTKVKRSKK